MASQKYLLFEDIFHIRALNENGKMFERVNRLHCKGTTFEVDLVLGIMIINNFII
jgi:DNA-directed RNA polymerase I, II, and III subunit RPABC3